MGGGMEQKETTDSGVLRKLRDGAVFREGVVQKRATEESLESIETMSAYQMGIKC